MEKQRPPIGSFHELGASRLLVDKRGTGSPAVVFLPGAGLTGLDYLQVHERVSRITTSIIYDRAGTGWSDRVSLPRTSRAVTDELHTLLCEITSGPVVVVGHSLGGIYARHYGARFPERTRGVVLLDPAHEDYDASMPPESTKGASKVVFTLLGFAVDIALTNRITRSLLERVPAIRRYQELYRHVFEQEMADWPTNVRASLVEQHASLDWLAVGLRETRKLDRLYDEIRATPVPHAPLIVLCSTGSDRFREAVSSGESNEVLQAEIEAKMRLYAKLASTVSRGEVRKVDCGHVNIPFRQVDAIVQAIEDVLRLDGAS